MATTLIKAAMTGQTAGTDLASYVAQTGDVAASFTRVASRSLGDNGSTAMYLKSFTNGFGVTGGTAGASTYIAGAKATIDSVDVSIVVNVPSATSNADYKSFSVGDDGATNHTDLDFYNTNGTYGISLYQIVNGSGNTSPVFTQAFSSAPAAGDHVLTLQMRGTGSSRTGQILWDGLAVGSPVALTSTTIIGRQFGVGGYFNRSSGSVPESDTYGAKLKSFQVVQNDTGTALAQAAPSVVAGSGSGTAKVTAPAATGGTAPYSYQFQRAPVTSGTPGTYANVGTAGTALVLNDTGLTPGQTYSYRVVTTDSASTPATATSAAALFTSPVPTFEVTTTPASMLIEQGKALTLAVNVAPVGGYTGTPALSITGLPTGVTTSFSALSNGSSILTLTAAGNAVTGAVEIGAVGADGSLVVTAPILLQVNPPSGVVYPVVTDVQATDLVTITRNGTTEQVAALALKAYLVSAG